MSQSWGELLLGGSQHRVERTDSETQRRRAASRRPIDLRIDLGLEFRPEFDDQLAKQCRPEPRLQRERTGTIPAGS
jgi:hypothetical protein